MYSSGHLFTHLVMIADGHCSLMKEMGICLILICCIREIYGCGMESIIGDGVATDDVCDVSDVRTVDGISGYIGRKWTYAGSYAFARFVL